MGLVPAFSLLAGTADVTALFRQRLQSLRVQDSTGLESDTLDIVLDNHDKAIERPRRGAELRLSLGYDGRLTPMGMFVVDETGSNGPPWQINITARASIFDATPSGKADLQTQKSRAWPAGTTLGAMVAHIAKEHGLLPSLSPDVAYIGLPYLAQTEESDLHLLARMAKTYDCVIRPANGILILAKRGSRQSASGIPLEPTVLTPIGLQPGGYRSQESARESAGSVVAFWREFKKSKRHQVTAGEGEPVTRLKVQYPTEAMALAAARAELQKRQRNTFSLSLTYSEWLLDVAAEDPIILKGFPANDDGEWIVTRAEHALDATTATTTMIEAERPNL